MYMYLNLVQMISHSANIWRMIQLNLVLDETHTKQGLNYCRQNEVNIVAEGALVPCVTRASA